MRMKNVSGGTVVIESLGLVLEADDEVELPDGYCLPRPGTNEVMEPTIALLAPQLQPVDPDIKKKWWKGLPMYMTPDPSRGPVSVERLVQSGMSPGVAELVAKARPAPPVIKPVTSTPAPQVTRAAKTKAAPGGE